MLRLQVCFLLAVFAIAFADDQPFRKFSKSFNMGCNDTICDLVTPDIGTNSTHGNSSFQQLPNLLYLHGALASPVNGVADTLHIVFTSYGGYPSALVVHCNMSSEMLVFDWHILLSNDSVSKFGGIKPPASCKNCYSFALVAVSAIDFNDTNESAVLDETIVNATTIVPLSRFIWSRMVNLSDPTMVQVHTDAVLNNGTYFTNNGMLKMSMAFGETAGSRATDLPQLQFSGNSIQLDTVFASWVSQFTSSRLGLELVLVADVLTTETTAANPAAAQTEAKVYSTQSIDDEYTPGTFTITDWITRGSLYDKLQAAPTTALDIMNGYLQYKPIAYTMENQYTVENTISVGNTNLKTDGSMLLSNARIHDALQHSIVAAYYQSAALTCASNALADCPSKYTLSAVNVTFGQVDDGFYKKTSWVRWTAQIGFGVPPQDAVSFLVIIIILVGLGIPIILMALGGVYVCIRKLRSSGSYDRIN